MVVDTYEPHEPWTPPRKYIDLYGDPDYRGPEPGQPRYGRIADYFHGDDPSRMLARMRALYAAEVTMTDRWLGVFLDRLHDLGLERETAIVLVADHGFLLGELRLHREDLLGAAPAADARAARGGAPRPPARRRGERLPGPDARRGAHAAVARGRAGRRGR